ncbi:hypothetical protein RN001_001911 [Aquatica leii]|uniref:15-oxoprostaglandin 13-reductase n=1 Tax=Aquatica leii TaxID=1421715 RepID=A0AAN7PCK7_9COLE|nr:hypothetical protein RN001_001911 [Aquatica leii]
MSTSGIYKSFIYSNPIKGLPTLSTFKLTQEQLRPLRDNEYITEAKYIRVGPNPTETACQIKLNSVPKATQLAKIIESRNKNFLVGQYVIGNFGWQTHTVVDLKTHEEVYLIPEIDNVPQTFSLGVLGIPGIAAYFGFFEICKPHKNDILVVSSAAGAVGSCVGQIAKIIGCTVIGITSSDKKCSQLMDIGFDHCINYKKDDVKEKLAEYTPNGIDCYFDNVGGELSSYVIYQMRTHGRICICGATALYYNNNIQVQEIQSPIKVKTVKMEGMHYTRWKDQWNSAIKQNLNWLKENKLKSKETILTGFENLPQIFIDTLKATSSPVFLKSTCASNSSRLSQSFSCTSTPSTSKTDKGDINGDAQFGFSTPTLTKSSSESKGFCDQVLDYLITIRTQNRQILKLLTTNTHNNSIKAFELPDDLELTLPVSNLTDLRRLEEYLSNNTNLSAVASYLSGLGGRDPTTKTNAVLRKLMTNEFAMKFSFLGIRQKKERL